MGYGLTHWSLPAGSLATALAYVSTNAAVTAGVYGTYLGAEKKMEKKKICSMGPCWQMRFLM